MNACTFNPLDYVETPRTFNDEIAQYVRDRLAPPKILATEEESWRVLYDHAGIAMKVDRDCVFDIVGSVAVCGEGEDYDVLICSSSQDARLKIEDAMRAQGFMDEGGEYPPDDFTSLRFDAVNVLVTDNRQFFDKWQRSVAVCKLVRDEFGFCDRPLRVAIHQAIMDEEGVR